LKRFYFFDMKRLRDDTNDWLTISMCRRSTANGIRRD
jgi:hypothetical protein